MKFVDPPFRLYGAYRCNGGSGEKTLDIARRPPVASVTCGAAGWRGEGLAREQRDGLDVLGVWEHVHGGKTDEAVATPTEDREVAGLGLRVA